VGRDLEVHTKTGLECLSNRELIPFDAPCSQMLSYGRYAQVFADPALQAAYVPVV